ncbi:MAG TPA: hypothetical protein VF723_12555 [Pyrinomonadaceae bacterium]|jgi:hypothetical protein
MNDDYLWDKSGEPDAEIERLERALGSLRYKNSEHELPPEIELRLAARRNFSPLLAAAAVFTMMLLGGALWLSLHRSDNATGGPSASAQAADAGAEQRPAVEENQPRPLPRIVTEQDGGQDAHARLAGGTPPREPVKTARRRVSDVRRRELAGLREQAGSRARLEQQLRREGLAARAQLIMAMQIASRKLNDAQKKVQVNREHDPVS